MGVTLRHVPGALFVAHQDVANARLQKWVVHGENAAAGQTKHGLYVFHLKRANECFGSGEYLFVRHRVSPGYGWWVMNMVLETKKPPEWVVFSAFGRLPTRYRTTTTSDEVAISVVIGLILPPHLVHWQPPITEMAAQFQGM